MDLGRQRGVLFTLRASSCARRISVAFDCTVRALDALLEGLWLDLMTMEKPYSIGEALETVYASLNAIFPRHYDASGNVKA